MALFGRDYGSDYGYRGDWRNRNTGYDGNYRDGGMGMGGMGTGGTWGGGMWGGGMRDRDESGWHRGGYDAGYMSRGGNGYDRNYKSRWQTDYGDPFGDRTSGTPMRIIRGEYHSDYDRNYRGGHRADYDRGHMGGNRSGYGNFGNRDRYDRENYSTNPMGYEPYRQGTWNRYDNQIHRGRDNDGGWF